MRVRKLSFLLPNILGVAIPSAGFQGKIGEMNGWGLVFFTMLKNRIAYLFQSKAPRGQALAEQQGTTIYIDPHRNDSFFFVAAQIVWLSIGLSVLSDAAETVLNWPHLLVVALSSGFMIGSAWLGGRLRVALSALAIPVMLSFVYTSYTHPGSNDGGFLLFWEQLFNIRSLELLSLFILMGSFIKRASTKLGSIKKFNFHSFVACLDLGVAVALLVYSDVSNAMASGESDLVSILMFRISSVLTLCLLGLSIRTSKELEANNCGLAIAQFTRIPVKIILLMVGTASAVFSDWISLVSEGWLQYASLLLPPLILKILGNAPPVRTLSFLKDWMVSCLPGFFYKKSLLHRI